MEDLYGLRIHPQKFVETLVKFVIFRYGEIDESLVNNIRDTVKVIGRIDPVMIYAIMMLII